jgi:hypothetical protein
MVSGTIGAMKSMIRAALLVGAAVAAAGSSNAIQQATSSPALTGGTCEGACRHYFDCKGIDDPELMGQCVEGCGQRGPRAAELGQYEAMDCDNAVALVDQHAGGEGWQGGMSSPVVSRETCQAGANGGAGADREMYAFLTRNAWCAVSSSEGVTTQARGVFGADGILAIQASSSSSQYVCYKLEGRELYLSTDGQSWEHEPLEIATGANGATIVRSRDREFSACP